MKIQVNTIDDLYKAQVKGFTRTRKGKTERVKPFERTVLSLFGKTPKQARANMKRQGTKAEKINELERQYQDMKVYAKPKYRIGASVSGGVTGPRSSYVKDAEGKVREFNSQEEAEAEAKRLRDSISPYSTATFHYWAEPIEKSRRLGAKDVKTRKKRGAFKWWNPITNKEEWIPYKAKNVQKVGQEKLIDWPAKQTAMGKRDYLD